jgi:lysylphosphatidylglycerol synthetase-like protein (DUF2156 family)
MGIVGVNSYVAWLSERAGRVEVVCVLTSISLPLNLYLTYIVVFHGAWVARVVFDRRPLGTPIQRLRESFEEHHKHQTVLKICFGMVVLLLGTCIALLAHTALVARSAAALPWTH